MENKKKLIALVIGIILIILVGGTCFLSNKSFNENNDL